jgi:hypothetical protein
MIVCDLCGEPKDCRQRQIDSKEYDICSECWKPFAEKLKGKGRVKKERETVFLPPVTKAIEPQEAKPGPGEPPTIWGCVNLTQ